MDMKRKKIKYLKRIIPVILLFCVNAAYGQWRFDYSINPSGISCAKLGYSGTRKALGNPRTGGFSTQQECEQHRQQLAGKTVRVSGDCTVKVECQPCTGSNSSSGSSSSNSGSNPNTSLEAVTSTYRPIQVNTDIDFNAIYNQNGNNELLFADNVKKPVQNTQPEVSVTAGSVSGDNFINNLQKHKQKNEGFDLNTVMTPRKDYPYLPNYAADAMKKNYQRKSRPIENQKIEYKIPYIDLIAGTTKAVIGLAGAMEAFVAIPAVNLAVEDSKVLYKIVKSQITGEYYDVTTKEIWQNAFGENGEKLEQELIDWAEGLPVSAVTGGFRKAGEIHLVYSGVEPIRAAKDLERLDKAVSVVQTGWQEVGKWRKQLSEDF
ncbi:MAG: hypothetical protein LBN27_11640 [Prevotellaceae bacterium]|jgi:hypothetical protein|nr:hypothetical protein [Prevotellaceae bacterium]